MASDSIKFIGTGKPATPPTNPHLDRSASRQGIRTTGIEKISEFQNVARSKVDPEPEEIGRYAKKVALGKGGTFDITG